MKSEKIVFIGAGNMGRCLIGGMLNDGYPAEHISVIDPDATALATLTDTCAINTTEDLRTAVTGAGIVVLAVKPPIMQEVALSLNTALCGNQPLLISVAAGIRTSDLGSWLGPRFPIIRVMPNTPALVRSGATALYATADTSTAQREAAESILRSVGMTLWLEDETMMDAVTALSGSGPAYFFRIMEILEDSGVKLGLSREHARLLTVQTAFGAAKLALESEADPSTLRIQVTSPGGTTESALNCLNEHGLQAAFDDALSAAKARAEELAETFGAAPSDN